MIYVHHDELLGRSPGTDPVQIQWRRTWDDDFISEDYLGFDGGARLARVYHKVGHPQMENQWIASLYFPAPYNAITGNSRRGIMLAVEDAYNAWRATLAPASR